MQESRAKMFFRADDMEADQVHDSGVSGNTHKQGTYYCSVPNVRLGFRPSVEFLRRLSKFRHDENGGALAKLVLSSTFFLL